jgi:hypothetical protein
MRLTNMDGPRGRGGIAGGMLRPRVVFVVIAFGGSCQMGFRAGFTGRCGSRSTPPSGAKRRRIASPRFGSARSSN